MNLALASYRNRDSRGGIVAGLAVALVLMLTPCCEIFAALHDGGRAAGETHSHSSSGDQHSPPGENCAPWFEQAFVPANDAVLLSTLGAGVDYLAWPAALALFVTASRLGKVVPHAGAPPQRSLYLLTQRFLL